MKPEMRQTFVTATTPALEPGALLDSVAADLALVLGAEAAAVTLLPGSATAAWETALGNTLSPGDRILLVRNGPFSARWAGLAEVLGLDVEIIDLPWGQGSAAEAIGRRLGADTADTIRAVLVTHAEAATGTATDIAAVRRAIDESFHDALLMVDLTATAGASPVHLDAWGIDLAVAGGRHALLLPPPVAMIAANPRARLAMRAATGPRSVADLRHGSVAPAGLPDGAAAALRAGLDALLAEGTGVAARRQARLGLAVRRAVAAWGLDTATLPGALPADTVTAVALPRHIDARAVIRVAAERWRTALGSGLGPLAGRVFRIHHGTDAAAMLSALAVAELALAEAGHPVSFGCGVAAAQAVLGEARPLLPALSVVAA